MRDVGFMFVKVGGEACLGGQMMHIVALRDCQQDFSTQSPALLTAGGTEFRPNSDSLAGAASRLIAGSENA